VYPLELCFRPGDQLVEDYAGQDEDPATEWEVEAVVDEARVGEHTLYLLKWKVGGRSKRGQKLGQSAVGARSKSSRQRSGGGESGPTGARGARQPGPPAPRALANPQKAQNPRPRPADTNPLPTRNPRQGFELDVGDSGWHGGWEPAQNIRPAVLAAWRARDKYPGFKRGRGRREGGVDGDEQGGEARPGAGARRARAAWGRGGGAAHQATAPRGKSADSPALPAPRAAPRARRREAGGRRRGARRGRVGRRAVVGVRLRGAVGQLSAPAVLWHTRPPPAAAAV
jgi:hypothetical protein